MNFDRLTQMWNGLSRPMHILLLALMDIALIGIGLCIFALFHHVIPREETSAGVVSSRGSVTTVQQPEAVEATEQPAAETAAEESTPEPVQEAVSADPVGYFGSKFADKFTSGEVSNTLLEDGTGV